ncbi:MAG: hypothetical protein GX303_03675 [Clostridiales bacterium]|nr:hypothetical protein [Clostridiales bacterium]
MKLYIKQKVFSFRDKFTVKDENGIDKYYVEGKLLSWGKQLYIFDRLERKVAFIKQRVFTFMPKYEVYVNDMLVSEIAKQFTFFKMRLTVSRLNWVVSGDFWAHSYKITSGDELIATIDKAWFSWGDSYVLDIHDQENEVIALAVILAIDCIIASNTNNS